MRNVDRYSEDYAHLVTPDYCQHNDILGGLSVSLPPTLLKLAKERRLA